MADPVGGREPTLTYRLLVSDPKRPSSFASEFGTGVQTSNFKFTDINSVFGKLQISVRYRKDCQFQVHLLAVSQSVWCSHYVLCSNSGLVVRRNCLICMSLSVTRMRRAQRTSLLLLLGRAVAVGEQWIPLRLLIHPPPPLSMGGWVQMVGAGPARVGTHSSPSPRWSLWGSAFTTHP